MRTLLENIADAKKLGTIYVLRTEYKGSSLANFFVLRKMEGSSSKRVALEIYHDEYSEDEDSNVSEFAVPTGRISTDFIHAVRMKKHGEYTGLAPYVQIYVEELGWKTATKWDGKRVPVRVEIID